MGKQMRPSSNEPNEEEMREAIAAIQKSMQDQEKLIRDILIALKGDEDMGHTGLIHRVNEHGKQIEKVKQAGYWAGGVTATIGAFLWAWEKLTKH